MICPGHPKERRKVTHAKQNTWGTDVGRPGSHPLEFLARALRPEPCPMARAQQTGTPPPGWYDTLLLNSGVLLQLVLVCFLWMQGDTDP